MFDFYSNINHIKGEFRQRNLNQTHLFDNAYIYTQRTGYVSPLEATRGTSRLLINGIKLK